MSAFDPKLPLAYRLISTHCGQPKLWHKLHMPLFQQASAMIAALRSILPHDRCFELAAQKRDTEALESVVRTRMATRNNGFAPWDIELRLLEAYLLLERGSIQAAQSSLIGIFSRIRASTNYNPDERAFLIRYGVSVLWLARGRVEPSCLLVIRHQLRNFDVSKVRAIILNRFPNPDEAD